MRTEFAAIATAGAFALAGVCCAAAPDAAADETSASQRNTRLPAIVVTATRTPQAAYDVPASIDAVYMDNQPDAIGVNPSEYLSTIPGLVARDRQNYAQDEQISIRGFGARSTFGVRGVRLYTDGIPATMPDGQGQVSHFNLDSAERIEVLRGPFSALYGNSSGGVIQIFTADGSDPPQLNLNLVGRQLRRWTRQRERARHGGQLRLQPRRHAFPDRRLPPPQRGAARFGQCANSPGRAATAAS